MKAEDVSRPAITLASGRTLQDLRNVLLKYRISRVVIQENGKPIGIVTEKDVSRFTRASQTSRSTG
ncbi:CBS domain-containing protein [Nitrososphaera sp.]|uniref:CBS domain-containing protein n=1 Tax=Nitrososphaera sp. TaxID=1971748 RepID=UPI0017C83D41|nr:CBS domain-containing protein [Nitrososphaera sp.]NWG37715.1 CBS domain-containing protein [Nitrososphaera sp.]